MRSTGLETCYLSGTKLNEKPARAIRQPVRAVQKSERRQAEQGAVAQLGERLICIQEVVGSIPISSTSTLGL